MAPRCDGCTAADLSARLADDADQQVSAWALRVCQRAERREINLDREYWRLLAPFIEAGLVVHSEGGYALALAGERAVRDMLGLAEAREQMAA
jgi:hypothetical protein